MTENTPAQIPDSKGEHADEGLDIPLSGVAHEFGRNSGENAIANHADYMNDQFRVGSQNILPDPTLGVGGKINSGTDNDLGWPQSDANNMAGPM